jgi:hypothetical protein
VAFVDRWPFFDFEFDFDSSGECIKFDKFEDDRLDPFIQNKYVFLY